MPVGAIFDIDAQIMFLDSAVDYADPDNEPVVLHELVHYLQAINGEDPPCRNRLETAAYRAQSLWSKATGRGDVPDPFTVLMLSDCEAGP